MRSDSALSEGFYDRIGRGGAAVYDPRCSDGGDGMSGWFRALFLFSSFGPLYAVLGLGLTIQNLAKPALIAWIASALSVFVFLYLRSGFRSGPVFHSKLEIDAQIDENILSYLIAYLPPIFIDNFKLPEKYVPAGAFYAILFVLMIRIDTLYVNPFFIMCGYKIYRVKLESGRSAVVVTRKREISKDEVLNLHELDSSRLYFAE